MTAPITEEQLAELERLEREATPGPWELKDGMLTFPPATEQDAARMSGASCCEWIGATMPILVAARNALPQLIAEVRRLRAVVDACARAGCPTAAEGKHATVFVTRLSNYEPAEIGEIYATREGAERSLYPDDVGWHVEEWKVLP